MNTHRLPEALAPPSALAMATMPIAQACAGGRERDLAAGARPTGASPVPSSRRQRPDSKELAHPRSVAAQVVDLLLELADMRTSGPGWHQPFEERMVVLDRLLDKQRSELFELARDILSERMTRALDRDLDRDRGPADAGLRDGH